MEYEKACSTALTLDLGLASYAQSKEKRNANKPFLFLDMSFDLLPKHEAGNMDSKGETENDRSSLKRRSSSSDDENHHHINMHDISNTTKNGCRKKLRLTKEQSASLEESFKLHTTLNTIQKQSLAEKLNLRPRQVEVWFQNRRARTKLKQTEVDFEWLKKWWEKLSDENRRLKKELEEVHALKAGPSSLHIKLQKAATLAMCSSCEKLLNGDIEGNINEGSIVAVSNVVRSKNKFE